MFSYRSYYISWKAIVNLKFFYGVGEDLPTYSQAVEKLQLQTGGVIDYWNHTTRSFQAQPDPQVETHKQFIRVSVPCISKFFGLFVSTSYGMTYLVVS